MTINSALHLGGPCELQTHARTAHPLVPLDLSHLVALPGSDLFAARDGARHGTVRGKIILPYMLINSARRAMMVPLLLFGLIEYLTDFDTFNTLIWQSILALTVGAPALMAIFCALLMRSPKAILFLPEYLVFRVIRAYFTLESMLSINIRGFGEHPYSRSALGRPVPSSVRVA